MCTNFLTKYKTEFVSGSVHSVADINGTASSVSVGDNIIFDLTGSSASFILPLSVASWSLDIIDRR